MRQRPSPTLWGVTSNTSLLIWKPGATDSGRRVARELPRYTSWEVGRAFHISRRGKENGAQTKKFQPFQATTQNFLQTGCRGRFQFPTAKVRTALPGQRFPVSV